MVGILDVATYVPPSPVDNVAQAAMFGETESFVRERLGALWLPRIEPQHQASDLAAHAIRRLQAKQPDLDLQRIGLLVVVTQNPDDSGLPQVSSLVQAKVGLPTTIAAFDIGLGCSGFVYGLVVAQAFMKAVGIDYGIVVTADPYSKILNDQDRATSMLFGDASTATLVGPGSSWRVSSTDWGTDGSQASAIINRDGRLHMNGRQVFGFANEVIPSSLRRVLVSEGLSISDVDLVCLHQGSRAIVQAIAKQFPGDEHRFLSDMEETGNTVSSTIPILLERHVLLSSASTVLISGFGVGLSWGTLFLRRCEERDIRC